MLILKQFDECYLNAKRLELDKVEERKRKRDETRDNRERGWEIAHVDEWSDDEERNEETENGETLVGNEEQDGEGSDDEDEETMR